MLQLCQRSEVQADVKVELNRLATDDFGGTDYFPVDYFIEKDKILQGEQFTFGGFGVIHRGTMQPTKKWKNLAQQQTHRGSKEREEHDAEGVSQGRHPTKLDICIKKIITKKMFVDDEVRTYRSIQHRA